VVNIRLLARSREVWQSFRFGQSKLAQNFRGPIQYFHSVSTFISYWNFLETKKRNTCSSRRRTTAPKRRASTTRNVRKATLMMAGFISGSRGSSRATSTSKWRCLRGLISWKLAACTFTTWKVTPKTRRSSSPHTKTNGSQDPRDRTGSLAHQTQTFSCLDWAISSTWNWMWTRWSRRPKETNGIQ